LLELEEEFDDEEDDPCDDELLTRKSFRESEAKRMNQPDDRHILPPDRNSSTHKIEEYRLRGQACAKSAGIWPKRFSYKSQCPALVIQQTNNESIAIRRRMAGWNVDYPAQVFGISGR